MSLRGKAIIFAALILIASFVNAGLDATTNQIGIDVALGQLEDSDMGAVNARAWSLAQYRELLTLLSLGIVFVGLFWSNILKAIRSPIVGETEDATVA